MRQNYSILSLLILTITLTINGYGQENSKNFTEASNNSSESVIIESSFIYQSFIDSDKSSNDIKFRKTRPGITIGFDYLRMINKSLYVEAGMIFARVRHIRDSVYFETCTSPGSPNCPLGEEWTLYDNVSIPIHLGILLNLGKDLYASSALGMMASKGIHYVNREILYDGSLYRRYSAWNFDLTTYQIALKLSLTKLMKNTPVSLIYRFNRPVNNLSFEISSFATHSIGISVGIWSNVKQNN